MGGRGLSSGMYSSVDISQSLTRWTQNSDSVTTFDKQALESFIKSEVSNKGPVQYAYGISRGISMSEQELNSMQVGGEFAESKLTSWSNRLGISQSFARNNQSNDKPNQVIIRTKSPITKGAKISGSGRKFDEGEVIMSSTAKFTITDIKKSGNYTEVWVKPKNK